MIINCVYLCLDYIYYITYLENNVLNIYVCESSQQIIGYK